MNYDHATLAVIDSASDTETARVLQAMSALGEFTVADLVRTSGVRPTTVRTVLQRRRNALLFLGMTETGRRGGQWKRYRFNPAVAGAPLPERAGAGGDDPIGDLLAAEELLLGQAPVQDRNTRASMLRRALAFRADAAQTGAVRTDVYVAHDHAVGLLIDIARAEEAGDYAALAVVRQRLSAAYATPLRGEPELVAAIERRIDESPLRPTEPAPVADALKLLFWLGEEGLPMTDAQLASAMQLPISTVSEMLGQLKRDGYVVRGRGASVSFTNRGREEAERLVSRHSMIHRFLTDVVGVPRDAVHEEAARLEDTMTPRFEAYVRSIVGDADAYPYGHKVLTAVRGFAESVSVPASVSYEVVPAGHQLAAAARERVSNEEPDISEPVPAGSELQGASSRGGLS
jgi:Mn-dependent DtxR family transcriptional regulator